MGDFVVFHSERDKVELFGHAGQDIDCLRSRERRVRAEPDTVRDVTVRARPRVDACPNYCEDGQAIS